MLEIDFSHMIGKGSNSRVYNCIFNGHKYAVKLPLSSERYISNQLQVDSMQYLSSISTNSFFIPQIVFFNNRDQQYGEVVVMDKLENIYPIDFLLRNGMLDSEYIILMIAEAIAILHDSGISGFNLEFYWSYQHRRISLLDIGPRYTKGYSSKEMVSYHYEIARKSCNKMLMWNLASELLPESDSIKHYTNILSGEYVPPLNELQESICESAYRDHICSVAQNHYLQIFSCFSPSVRNQMINLFIKRYSEIAHFPDYLYIRSLLNSHRIDLKESTAYLYYSKWPTLSKMSNTVSYT